MLFEILDYLVVKVGKLEIVKRLFKQRIHERHFLIKSLYALHHLETSHILQLVAQDQAFDWLDRILLRIRLLDLSFYDSLDKVDCLLSFLHNSSVLFLANRMYV